MTAAAIGLPRRPKMAVSDRLPVPTLGACRFIDVIVTPSGSDPILYRKGTTVYLANASLEQVAFIRKTAAYTLTAADARVVAADTTAAAYTLALPPSPTDGMSWLVFDGAAAGSWHTNNLTLSGNGKSIVIAGSAAAATVAFSSRSGAFRVYYHATSDRWHIVEQSPGGAFAALTATSSLAVSAPGTVNLGRATVSQATNVNTDVTCNASSGVITTQTASTAAVTMETGFTLNNSCIVSTSVIMLQIVAYSGTHMANGIPYLACAAPGNGTVVIKIGNIHDTNALSGTLKIHFIVA
jgi:hypothetical protein